MATVALVTVALVGLVISPGCLVHAQDLPVDDLNDDITTALAIASKDGQEPEKDAGEEDDAVATDAANAHKAVTTAKEAAKVAHKVATKSIKMTEHAKSALRNARDAVNSARADTEGLSSEQMHSLKMAEKQLTEATKAAEYGQVKDAKYVKSDVANKQLEKLEEKMEAKKEKKEDSSELEEMRKEIEDLREQLKKKGDSSDEEMLEDLQKQIEEMEKAEKKEDKADGKSHDEMKAEIERLREKIKELEDMQGEVSQSMPAKDLEEEDSKEVKKVEKKPLEEDEPAAERVDEKGLDIDTAMPYGELEPFGREDTAQELTENSIHESDEMVDQLERAEVAEEKRSVFRALTRLRGAAITSFDGVARSQTGNIDEYNKIHQWRDSHPLHHLADEESDVTKWAFPDNAD